MDIEAVKFLDQLTSLVPQGWRLRLTNWEDEASSGWAAEVFHRDGRYCASEGGSPAEALHRAVTATHEG